MKETDPRLPTGINCTLKATLKFGNTAFPKGEKYTAKSGKSTFQIRVLTVQNGGVLLTP